MATLFDMYKDVATPDIYQEVKASRQETEGNTKKTQDTAFGMLKKSNIGTLQQQYRAGTGRFAGITDPDKKFQVYYDALKALDPQAAQDAAKVYGEERERRINVEIADSYKGEGGDPELQALENAIKELKSSIASDEASAKAMQVEQEKRDQLMTDQGVESLQTSDLSPSLDTGRLNNPVDLSLTPDEGQQVDELQQDWSKLGYVPLPRGDREATKMSGYTPSLTNYYSTDKKMPTNDISLSTEDTIIDDSMEGYIPMSRYGSYSPTARSLANIYRGR